MFINFETIALQLKELEMCYLLLESSSSAVCKKYERLDVGEEVA